MRKHLAELAQRDDIRRRLQKLIPLILLFALLDLEPARPLVESCYATLSRDNIGGNAARDPIVMLRAVILLSVMGYSSFHVLVRELEGHPELAVLCGFDPDPHTTEPEAVKLVAASTFYDYPQRLLDGPFAPRCDHVVRPTDRLRGTTGLYLRQLSHERAEIKALSQAEMAEHHESRTQMEVRKALARLDDALPEDFAARLNTILMCVAVAPSADAGVLGDVEDLHVIADGSAFASQANGKGRRACTCTTERCDCPRLYADADAQWGWDSHAETYVFGDRVMTYSVHAHQRDLPIHILCEGANAHDGPLGVKATARLVKQLETHLPQATPTHGIYDAGFDATPFYQMLHHLLMRTPLLYRSSLLRWPSR